MILKNQFRKQSFYSSYKFSNIGQTYLKVEIYEEIFLKKIFIILEIFHANSKTKKIRVLFSESDFDTFNLKCDLKEGARKFLIELNRNLLTKLFLSRHLLIQKPVISLGSQFYELNNRDQKKEKEKYWMNFNIYSKILYQTTLKINKNYVICSVKYMMNKKSWGLFIYSPNDGSIQIANLYLEELQNLPNDFWKTFPKRISLDSSIKSFQKFWKDAETKEKKSNNIIKKIALATKFLFKFDIKSIDFVQIYVNL
jgi:hypothetical protein